MNLKKSKMFMLIFCVFSYSIALTGCDIAPAESSLQEYGTQEAYSVTEYAMLRNQEITAVAETLTTQMIAVTSYQTSSSASAVSSAKESLSVIEDAVSMITTTSPAKTYEDERDTLLDVLNAAESHMTEYINDLESGKDITQYRQLFSNDVNQLTALGQITY